MNYFSLVFSCALLCLYIQVIIDIVFSILCLSIPWIVWCTIVVFLLIHFSIRIPPVSDNEVTQVLGINPFLLEPIENKILLDEPLDDIPYTIRAIAHRGAQFDYPENSITAFKKCHEMGCEVIEFDVSLTKDNIPIAFHDDSIERLTGKVGDIAEMDWNDLKKYDISATHMLKSRFGFDERIALLDEVIECCLENNQKMFIDIKSNHNDIVNIILKIFKKWPQLYKNAVVTSFNPQIIYMIRRKDYRIITGLNWRPQFFAFEEYNGRTGPIRPRFTNLFIHIGFSIVDFISDWIFVNILYYILGISFVLIHKDFISLDYVRQWYEKGVRVIAWTVNLPSEKSHFNRNLRVSYMTDTILSESVSY